MKFSVLIALLAVAAADNPIPSGETLRYAVNWPSGLSLGEGSITAKRDPTGPWQLSLQLDAAIPGFQVVDTFRSRSSAGFCSSEFQKTSIHGKRTARETTVFDPAAGLAVRTTEGGGKSEIPFSGCARDALAFLFHLRQEIAQGRVPSAQTVYFGSAYQVRLDYKGTQAVRIGDASEQADRIVASLKGPASQHTFEIFLARDSARTPLVIRVPLPLGTFSMEIVR